MVENTPKLPSQERDPQKLYGHIRDMLSAVGIEDASLEARWLIEHVCGGAPQGNLTDEQVQKLQKMVEKRGTRYPLQYIFGEWDFLDITLAVGDGVLIPRQDTECVCLAAIEKAKQMDAPVVVDLCSGSGAIALGVKQHVPSAKVTAVELSDDALVYLRRNAAEKIAVVQADVFTWQNECAPESIDVLTVNPPYIAAPEMKTLAPELAFEPRMALVAEEDGLAFYRHIAQNYRFSMRKCGWIVLEIGYRQADDVNHILHQNGWKNVEIRRDLNGNNRCIIAQKL